MTYSGSSNSYFRQLPNLDYPSLRNDRTSAFDYEVVKNIFKRAVMRDDIYNSVINFEKYSNRDRFLWGILYRIHLLYRMCKKKGHGHILKKHPKYLLNSYFYF